MDPRQSHSIDGEARFRLRQQALLQQYLVLQKEFVSNKRKLQETKRKKEALLDEVRFLRERRRFLLITQSQTLDQEQEHSHLQKADMGLRMNVKDKYYSVSEAVSDNTSSSSEPIRASGLVEHNGKNITLESLRVGKKQKGAYPGGRMLDKRKISWQEQVALLV